MRNVENAGGKRERERERERESTYNGKPDNKDPHIHPSQDHLPLAFSISAPVQIQPEHPAEPVGEPARKQSADEREQVAEDGDCLGDHPRHYPEYEHDGSPDAQAGPGALAHAVGAPVESYVDVFGGNVAVYDAGNSGEGS